MVTVKKLYENAFRIGREVQIKEQTGQDIDGRDTWNTLERTTRELKDLSLTNDAEILQYNFTLKPIYLEMNTLIIAFEMDKSEFNPKSNHFFCQLMNLVDKKSNFEIKLNKIMQIGFNAGQLSVFLENNNLPSNQTDIAHFIMRNKQKLGVLCHTTHQISITLSVGVIKWRIDLIEQAKWCRIKEK